MVGDTGADRRGGRVGMSGDRGGRGIGVGDQLLGLGGQSSLGGRGRARIHHRGGRLGSGGDRGRGGWERGRCGQSGRGGDRRSRGSRGDKRQVAAAAGEDDPADQQHHGGGDGGGENGGKQRLAGHGNANLNRRVSSIRIEHD